MSFVATPFWPWALVLALFAPACDAGQAENAIHPFPVPVAELPALTGRVVDNAYLLPREDENRLTGLLERLERRTTDQLVVVTLPSLNGRPIEDVGLSIGRHWQIGQADRNNGVLLIVAPSDRRARIEVGCGLERVLPDERAAEITRDQLLPHFREQAFPAGISEGSEAIVRMLIAGADVPRGGDC